MLSVPLEPGDALLVKESDGSERAVRFIRWTDCVVSQGTLHECFIGERIEVPGATRRIRKVYFMIDILRRFHPQSDPDKEFEDWLLGK